MMLHMPFISIMKVGKLPRKYSYMEPIGLFRFFIQTRLNELIRAILTNLVA
jgi:hypothetical protein